MGLCTGCALFDERQRLERAIRVDARAVVAGGCEMAVTVDEAGERRHRSSVAGAPATARPVLLGGQEEAQIRLVAAQLAQRAQLQLADALARDPERSTDLVERPRLAARVQTEA